jgi:hypothetical protein
VDQLFQASSQCSNTVRLMGRTHDLIPNLVAFASSSLSRAQVRVRPSKRSFDYWLSSPAQLKLLMDYTASTMSPRQITGGEEGERMWGPIRAEATLHPPAVGFLSTFLAKPELPVKAPFFQWFTSLNLTPDFFDRAIRPPPHSKGERALTVL